MEKKLEDYYVLKDNKKLAYGYTTGSCAAAAAKAAASMLFFKEEIIEVSIETPFGIKLHLTVKDIRQSENEVSCAIQKNGGDDPDATNGMLIYACVQKSENEKNKSCEIQIDGGVGIGRVTKPGLDQPIGSAAINHVPREMILKEVKELAEIAGFSGDVRVSVFTPKGEEVAKKTFNQRLGIIGGISILGTTGIVVPMSEDALLKTIRTEIRVQRAQNEEVLLFSPGNYGETFVKEHTLFDSTKVIQCSNYIGKTIDMAIEEGAKELIFVSHIGKFIKLAGGIMDTHSKNADCRAELFATCALLANVDVGLIHKLLNSNTTEACVSILKEADVLEAVMHVVMEKIEFYLNNRAKQVQVKAIVFSSVYGFLGATSQVDCLKILTDHNS